MSILASSVPTTSNPKLANLIGNVESNNRFDSLRFERRTFNNITNSGTTPLVMTIAKANNCSTETARMIYSTSWGAFQIMGFNIYGPLVKYQGTIANWLFNRDAQIDGFFRFVDGKGIDKTVEQLRDDVTRNKFALTYNGSTEYAVRMEAAMKELGYL